MIKKRMQIFTAVMVIVIMCINTAAGTAASSLYTESSDSASENGAAAQPYSEGQEAENGDEAGGALREEETGEDHNEPCGEDMTAEIYDEEPPDKTAENSNGNDAQEDAAAPEDREWSFEFTENGVTDRVSVEGRFMPGSEIRAAESEVNAEDCGGQQVLRAYELSLITEDARKENALVKVTVDSARIDGDDCKDIHILALSRNGGAEEIYDYETDETSVSFYAEADGIFALTKEENEAEEETDGADTETEEKEEKETAETPTDTAGRDEFHEITAEKTEAADIAISGTGDAVSVNRIGNVKSEEGLTVIRAFSFEKNTKKDAGKKTETALRDKRPAPFVAQASLSSGISLDETESVAVYSIKDGALSERISGDLGTEPESINIPDDADGIAIVRDSGFRRKSLETGEGSVLLDGMLPKNAEAEAEDVTENVELGEDRNVITAYDISILDSGEKYQPGEERPVSVTIADPLISEDGDIEVWHINDDGRKERIDDARAENGRVSFNACSFSVYAVVDGPPPVEIETTDVQDIQELSGTCGSESFYMSVLRSGSRLYFTNELDTQASKRLFRTTPLVTSASEWTFVPAGAENCYRISTEIDGTVFYITNPSGNYAGLSESEGDGCVFSVSGAPGGRFYLKISGQNKWLQYSNGGGGFRFWTDNNDANNPRIFLTYASSSELEDDVYGLDGKTYGILCYSDGTYGEALMAETAGNGKLSSLRMRVRVPLNGDEGMYVAHDADMTFWTFSCDHSDRYRISTTVNGERKYLGIGENGLILTDEENAGSIQVSPGSGADTGKIMLSADGLQVSFNGTSAFETSQDRGATEWLSLAERSELTEDSFIVYSAQKVSVSDTERVKNGSKIIIYTRVWNAQKKQYDYYAVDHDGSLVPCYETTDSIEWVGDRLNTILWQFTEYHWEGTDTPNYYYDIKNPYENKFLAPQTDGGQVLSDEPIGLSLNGRRYGDYYTKIVAWDDPYYTYAALKTNDGHTRLETCPMSQGADFYFAVMQDIPGESDDLTQVPTIDNNEHGITMRMVNFPSNTKQNTVLGSTAGGLNKPPTQGLLSTSVGENGYPSATITGRSLSELFGNAEDVNHLFIDSVYKGTGYYTFDSTQNFASLTESGDFKVYREIGTADEPNRASIKHGQFFPYNDIAPGVFASVNSENLYDALMRPLPETDPRKYEKMYLVGAPDYYFGMELSADFVQTPSGLDAWGHDIIYRFSGDDDFWLYVDGQLVIDLGGIHSAVPGSVNFKTGELCLRRITNRNTQWRHRKK